MKKIIRLLTNSDYLAHTSPLFKELSILNLNDLHKNQIALTMHKASAQRRLEKLRAEKLLLQPNHCYQTRETTLRLQQRRLQKN